MEKTFELVEVALPKIEDFGKVAEVLTRIGIASNRNKTFTQTCHILTKDGRFHIAHFKELFVLDGLSSTINEDDIARRNKIISILQRWGMIDVIDKSLIKEPMALSDDIHIIKNSEKSEWKLVHKFRVIKDAA